MYLRLCLVILISAVVLSACNFSISQLTPTLTTVRPSESAPGSSPTKLTEIASMTPTRSTQDLMTTTPDRTRLAQTLDPTASNQTPGLSSSTPTHLPSPSATAICDRASPGIPIDITIPDDTRMQPGQSFTKTWRLINAGVCPWTRDFAVVFFSGKILGAQKVNYFSKRVDPGDSVDISLDMVSPMKPGTYQSNWKLNNLQNQLFGIGPNGDSAFWVRIIVNEPNTATMEPTTSTPIPTVAIATSGVATLKLGDALDLDANLVVPPPADMLFNTNTAGAPLLTPQGTARLSVFGANVPTREDCQNAALGQDPVDLGPISSGFFFCYHTRQDRPGWLRLVSVDNQVHTVSVEFLTWAVP